MKHVLVFFVIFYLSFAFGCKSYDPMMWSTDAVAFCSILVVGTYIIKLAIDYIGDDKC